MIRRTAVVLVAVAAMGFAGCSKDPAQSDAQISEGASEVQPQTSASAEAYEIVTALQGAGIALPGLRDDTQLLCVEPDGCVSRLTSDVVVINEYADAETARRFTDTFQQGGQDMRQAGVFTLSWDKFEKHSAVSEETRAQMLSVVLGL